MIGNLQRVPTSLVTELRADPSRITGVLYPESATGGAIHGGDQLDLDKTWHALHFLLTGEPWGGAPPLNFLVSGTEVGDIDVGYGPARSFTAEETREIAAALAPITEATLRARFDPAAMMAAEIYPAIWDRDPAQDDTLGYVLERFGPLKQFVTSAAEHGEGLLVYLS